MTTVSGRAVLCVFLLISVLLCASLGANAVSATGPEHRLSTAGSEGGTNESVPHQNPDEYDDEVDADSTASWLEDQLATRLEDSSIALSDGQYEVAQEFIGEEYEEQFEQYVEVEDSSEQTDTDVDDNNSISELLNESGQEQRQYATLLAEYNETREEYDDAVETGDDEQARTLARELNVLAEEIEGSSADLDRLYDDLSVMTERDFSDSQNATAEMNASTQEEQSTIRQTEFIQTDLNLTPSTETASFTDPLTVSGEVKTADGSQLENETIELAVEDQTIIAEADSDGDIKFDYQPTMDHVSTDSLTITYVPATESGYLGSETQVNVSLEQTETELSIQDSPEELAYGNEGTISGEFSAEGTAVNDVPIAITLDGEKQTTATVENGSFSSSVNVPAEITDGERRIGAEFPATDRVLATAEANTSVNIAETETNISADTTIEAAENGTDQLTVNGSLETTEGDGVANESVLIEIDGMSSETVMTDDEGAFSTLIMTPAAADDQVKVTVSYVGTGTSFAPAAQELTVSLSGNPSLLKSGSIRWIGTGGGVGLLAVSGALVWFRRRGDTPSQTIEDEQETLVEPDPEPAEGVPTDALLLAASDQLSGGQYDLAVRNAFAAVRNSNSRTDEYGRHAKTLTHWEFYDHYRESMTGSSYTESDLREVTEIYERAAFTPQPILASEATTVLEMARHLCSAVDTASDESPEH